MSLANQLCCLERCFIYVQPSFRKDLMPLKLSVEETETLWKSELERPAASGLLGCVNSLPGLLETLLLPEIDATALASRNCGRWWPFLQRAQRRRSWSEPPATATGLWREKLSVCLRDARCGFPIDFFSSWRKVPSIPSLFPEYYLTTLCKEVWSVSILKQFPVTFFSI